MRPCFPSVEQQFHSKTSVISWLRDFEHQTLSYQTGHDQALARLLPLLICGEQSSQWVFHNERERLIAQGQQESVEAFEEIVADEQYHEVALEAVMNKLPQPKDITSIKRRSQRFYTLLGRQETLGDHFAQIACLDALVCQIMKVMEKSALGADHPFTLLCRAIKQDEAKHVSIAKKHAKKLGFDRSEWHQFQHNVALKLRVLLESEQQAFSVLNVDLDDIFLPRKPTL
ncbi:hypothetical protein [Vibrio sp. SCSIO 43136]|uniref:hypothetical protein n=1 Tax=Vibrio sp. SCSIO 43136 TaxID=2819101 RepID=UPI002074BF8C|nr:hypothetical protein [Vibrio sp. SCSIO 43136]USD67907.1 hypothetical protein J4N39_17125 [Vibrio sp. SCSIO 43136]